MALMNAERHFGFYQGERPACWENRRGLPQDQPWRRKRDRLVWRGSERTGRSHGRSRGELLEAFRRRQRDDYARRRGPRDPDAGNPHGRRARPDVENDVASGLKWMLYSDPVVFMPRPTHETWAMEGLLRPYVHYVPVEADLPRSGRTRMRTGRARSRGGQRVREEALREPQGERRQRVDPPRDVPEVSGPVWRGAAEVPPPRYVWTIKTK